MKKSVKKTCLARTKWISHQYASFNYPQWMLLTHKSFKESRNTGGADICRVTNILLIWIPGHVFLWSTILIYNSHVELLDQTHIKDCFQYISNWNGILLSIIGWMVDSYNTILFGSNYVSLQVRLQIIKMLRKTNSHSHDLRKKSHFYDSRKMPRLQPN